MIRTPSHLLHICHATIKTAGSPALRKPFFGFLCACRLSFCHRIWRALGTSRAQRPRGPAIIQHSLGLRWCQVGVDSIETFSIVDGKAIPRRLQSHPRRCVPPHLEADSELTDRFVAARLQTATVRSPPGCQPPCRRAVLSNDVDRRARAGELHTARIPERARAARGACHGHSYSARAHAIRQRNDARVFYAPESVLLDRRVLTLFALATKGSAPQG